MFESFTASTCSIACEVAYVLKVNGEGEELGKELRINFLRMVEVLHPNRINGLNL
jgi:hypothetical protein